MTTYPLSESQYGIVLDWIQHPQLTQNNICMYYRFPAQLDAKRLRDSLQKVIDSHDVFFTHIVTEQGQLRQFIDRSRPVVVGYEEMAEESFEDFRSHYCKPFDIFNDVLMRMTVVKTEKYTSYLLDTNHLVSDISTWVILWDQLAKVFDGKELPLDDAPFADYVEDQRKAMEGVAYQQAADYYQQLFRGLTMTRVPTKNPEAVGAFHTVSTVIPRTPVDNYCTTVGYTPNIVFMSAYSMVLSAFSGEEKVAFYSVNHGRTDRKYRKSAGMFIKTVPFKGDLSDPQLPVTDFFHTLKQQMFNNVRHGIYPFNRFCGDLGILPENSFTFQLGNKELVIGGYSATVVQFYGDTTLDSISTQIFSFDDHYQIVVDYNEQRYSQWLMQQFAHAILSVMENIIANPSACLKDISFVSEEDAREILRVSSGTSMPSAASYEHHFIDMFTHQVALHPQSTAVVDCNGSLSYAELDKLSSLLAMQLMQKEQILPDDTVTLLLPRKKDYMIAVLATMKAGACYIPLATDNPADRISYIRKDSKARLNIDSDYMYRFLHDAQEAPSCQFQDFPHGSNAYIIYTSGSTGNPKGVLVSQRALCSFIRNCQFTYSLTPADKILCHATFSFDSSIEDQFPILTIGGELHILAEELRTDLKAVRDYIVAHGITGTSFTTAFGELLLSAYPDLPLKYVTLGGERLDKVPEGVNSRFFNSYGPTEFTVGATYWEYPLGTDKTHVTIGRPACDCMILVLDRLHRLLPLGCPGELCLAGPQIAEGYWGKPVLTSERFVSNPYSMSDADHLMFCTGDIGLWNADNELEFIGRNDSQVKLRGYRIELGEIEAVMVQTEWIGKAVAKIVSLNGRDVICAWFTARDPVDTDRLKTVIARKMPKYMVPEVFIQIDEMPVSANGKIDPKQLPMPETRPANKPFVAAATEKEKLLSEIVAKVAEIDRVSVTDDLFEDVGLSSLQAAQMAFMASSRGIAISVSMLYEKHTIRDICTTDGRVLCYWLDGNCDPSKPVMVIVCGYLYLHPRYDDLVAKFRDKYFIYVIDSFLEIFLWSQDISLDRLLDEYMRVYKRDLADKQIHFLTGICYGSDLSLAFARRIKEELHVEERVLAFDPIFVRSEIQETPPLEFDCGELVIEQYRVSNTLALTFPIPDYDGPFIRIMAMEYPKKKYLEYEDVFLNDEEQQALNALARKNEDRWLSHFPTVPVYHIPGDHYHYVNQSNMSEIEFIINKHWPI